MMIHRVLIFFIFPFFVILSTFHLFSRYLRHSCTSLFSPSPRSMSFPDPFLSFRLFPHKKRECQQRYQHSLLHFFLASISFRHSYVHFFSYFSYSFFSDFLCSFFSDFLCSFFFGLLMFLLFGLLMFLLFRTSHVPSFRTSHVPSFRTSHVPSFRTFYVPSFRTSHVPSFRTFYVSSFSSFPCFFSSFPRRRESRNRKSHTKK